MKNKKCGTDNRKNPMEQISLKNFSFFYGNKLILSNINFSLFSNDFMCLCGSNGCGKSTLLNSLFENSFKNCTSKEKAKKISFLSQKEEPLWDNTVFDTILTGRFCHTGIFSNYTRNDKEICEKIMEEFDILHLKEKSIKEISGGEFQKVRLARCFAQGSETLILDEPLTALDFIAQEKFLSFLKEKCKKENKTVLITIHDINLAIRFSEKIAFLGKADEKNNLQFFIQGETNAVATKENISKTYNENVSTFLHPLYNKIQVGLLK